jgi:hypothetical protein
VHGLPFSAPLKKKKKNLSFKGSTSKIEFLKGMRGREAAEQPLVLDTNPDNFGQFWAFRGGANPDKIAQNRRLAS